MKSTPVSTGLGAVSLLSVSRCKTHTRGRFTKTFSKTAVDRQPCTKRRPRARVFVSPLNFLARCNLQQKTGRRSQPRQKKMPPKKKAPASCVCLASLRTSLFRPQGRAPLKNKECYRFVGSGFEKKTPETGGNERRELEAERERQRDCSSAVKKIFDCLPA